MASTDPSPVAAFWTRSRHRVGLLAGGRGSVDAHEKVIRAWPILPVKIKRAISEMVDQATRS